MLRSVGRAMGLALLGVVLFAAAPAQAQWRPWRSVPEFDPAAAGALAVLIAGGSILVARRRGR